MIDKIGNFIKSCPHIPFPSKMVWTIIFSYYGIYVLAGLIYLVSWINDPSAIRSELLLLLEKI